MRLPAGIGLGSALALALLSAASLAQAPPGRPGYRLIVNANNPVTSLDRRFVEDAFLKKIKSWPDGETLRPVDLPLRSEIRERFSDEVLRRPLAALQAYWQQRIFSGRDVPPPAVDADADVVKYVGRFEGGIGYVSASAPLAGTKAVPLR